MINVLRHTLRVAPFLYSQYESPTLFWRTVCTSLRLCLSAAATGSLSGRRAGAATVANKTLGHGRWTRFPPQITPYSPTIRTILSGAVSVSWILRSPTEFRFRHRTNLNALVEALNCYERNHFVLLAPTKTLLLGFYCRYHLSPRFLRWCQNQTQKNSPPR